jgi:GNAT superfamily N-acetyltransferase
MTEIVFRVANADDLLAIATVWYRGWLDGHMGHVPAAIQQHRRLADFRQRVPERLDATTVATVESHVVGFVTVHDDEIEQLYVAEAARGSGVAAALLRRGENVIAARFDLAWLAVVAGNVRARRFYARNGWCDSGAIAYNAQIAGGTFAVASRRYEKRMTDKLSHG